jgi:hypothetical protein
MNAAYLIPNPTVVERISSGAQGLIVDAGVTHGWQESMLDLIQHLRLSINPLKTKRVCFLYKDSVRNAL